MSIKKIKQHNKQKFLDDIKRISNVMVYCECNSTYLGIKKREVMSLAETQPIHYYINRNIFVVKREAMIIT